MRHSAQGITLDMYPKTITMAGISMALNYYFDPAARETVSRSLCRFSR